jgi:hypothetical protein
MSPSGKVTALIAAYRRRELEVKAEPLGNAQKYYKFAHNVDYLRPPTSVLSKMRDFEITVSDLIEDNLDQIFPTVISALHTKVYDDNKLQVARLWSFFFKMANLIPMET